MFERLDQIEARCEELANALASPEIVNDSARYQKTAKAHAEIAPMVEKYREYKDLTKGIAESKALLADEKDAEMRAYAQDELTQLEARVKTVEEDLKVLLLPKDPNDEKNIILEIRAGTGGDEATLFAAEIFRMYTRYAESQRWKVEVLSSSESSPSSKGTASFRSSNMKAAFTVCSAFPRPSSRDACIPQRSLSRSCQKQKTST